MSKSTNPKEIILEFVKQNPGCSIDDIAGNNAIPKIVIHNSLASLVKSQTINMELEGDVKNFMANEVQEEQAPKEKSAKSKPKVEDDEVLAPSSGKDFKKLSLIKLPIQNPDIFWKYVRRIFQNILWQKLIASIQQLNLN